MRRIYAGDEADGGFEHVALGIQIEDTQWTDDDSLKQEELLLKIAESTSCAKTSCPSPERYMESYHCDAERIYVVTLSAELSGSYNSAVLGKNLYEEEYGEKQIHVFNSRSASVGETLIALKVQQCEKAGMTFEEVVESVECYIEEQHTYFVLENLDTLRKNGRLTGIKSLVAGALISNRSWDLLRGNDLSEGKSERHEKSTCEDGGLRGSRCGQCRR